MHRVPPPAIENYLAWTLIALGIIGFLVWLGANAPRPDPRTTSPLLPARSIWCSIRVALAATILFIVPMLGIVYLRLVLTPYPF